MANSRTRNIRKRQFDASKMLKLYKNYHEHYKFLNGDHSTESDFKTFEQVERIDTKDKIAEMFCKKKMNVPIPDINNYMKENISNKSDGSS